MIDIYQDIINFVNSGDTIYYKYENGTWKHADFIDHDITIDLHTLDFIERIVFPEHRSVTYHAYNKFLNKSEYATRVSKELEQLLNYLEKRLTGGNMSQFNEYKTIMVIFDDEQTEKKMVECCNNGDHGNHTMLYCDDVKDNWHFCPVCGREIIEIREDW